MAGSQEKSLKVHLVSLGCAKNLVDSERLLGEALRSLGAAYAPTPEEADLVMLNTCAFVREAAEEAVSAVFELKSRLRPGARLAVLGCLPKLHGELAEALPEADLVLPVGSYEHFPELARGLFAGAPAAGRGAAGEEGRAEARPGGAGRAVQAAPGSRAGSPDPGEAAAADASTGKALSGKDRFPAPAARPLPFESWERAFLGTPRFRSYLKIAEGCGRRCTYCLIPSIRGPLAPRPLEDLLREAEALCAAGALELTLVAQDLTAWREGRRDLAGLCRALAELSGLRWIRLLYLHPEALTPRLVRELRDCPKVIPYLDMPFQHASPKILAAMGRGRTRPLETVGMARGIWPEAALRTTLMTGFPGEGEEDFALLRNFLAEARLDHAGFFKFSPEEGTAAARMPGRPSRAEAERRRRSLAALQRRISRGLNRARVGLTAEVLVEGPSEDAPEVACGRAAFQAPDADGLVYFDGEQPAAGSMVLARFLQAGDFDLKAEVVPAAGLRATRRGAGPGPRGGRGPAGPSCPVLPAGAGPGRGCPAAARRASAGRGRRGA
ncbi:MAG: radical SAM protein [Deltaproteobacteria bacterium]|nr:radical SAM protein [Deltaproteobacteria bacterium]